MCECGNPSAISLNIARLPEENRIDEREGKPGLLEKQISCVFSGAKISILPPPLCVKAMLNFNAMMLKFFGDCLKNPLLVVVAILNPL